MTHIMVMAQIDGAIAQASFHISQLEWVPLSHGDSVAVDALPRRICEITILNDVGAFRQIFPVPPSELVGDDERTLWGAVKEWWSK